MTTNLPDYHAQGYKSIIATLEGSILTIVINRAKYRNTFGGTLDKDLADVFQLCDRDDRVRVVILTAEHTAPAYCSGADISNGWNILWLEDSEKEGEHALNISIVIAHRDSGGQISMAIMNCRKITIAAINGHAAGVGMTALQLPFDFRFVWAGARLSFPFVRRGIVPEGHSRANSLLLAGATVSPDSKFISDLYHDIIPTREAVYPVARAFAEELATNTSQVAIAYTKSLLQHPGDSIEENHLLDSRAIKLLGSSADGNEGIQSFKERRLPKFTGTLSKDSSPWFPWFHHQYQWRRIDVKHHKAKL
ncbi:hypothetical protein CVT25_014523 [Psilocybe cyanescens]|uniref:Enoyl-CoA hydratase n=1 Tax=Psilocybe cyanescens TaxID=93625 RepID=A0A409WR44_PSICY|nr:hypothetical protein CVT25_014523 [Psilocybe cyanescens]